MDVAQVYVGQRIRVNVPGIGDHGQLGTIKKVRGNQCFVRLDWDQRLQHLVRFYAKDLDPVPDESLPVRESGGMLQARPITRTRGRTA